MGGLFFIVGFIFVVLFAGKKTTNRELNWDMNSAEVSHNKGPGFEFIVYGCKGIIVAFPPESGKFSLLELFRICSITGITANSYFLSDDGCFPVSLLLYCFSLGASLRI